MKVIYDKESVMSYGRACAEAAAEATFKKSLEMLEEMGIPKLSSGLEFVNRLGYMLAVDAAMNKLEEAL